MQQSLEHWIHIGSLAILGLGEACPFSAAPFLSFTPDMTSLIVCSYGDLPHPPTPLVRPTREPSQDPLRLSPATLSLDPHAQCYLVPACLGTHDSPCLASFSLSCISSLHNLENHSHFNDKSHGFS